MSNVFDKIFNKKDGKSVEEPVFKKENDSENKTEQEINAEAEKLEENFGQLQEEIKDFGSEDELKEALEKNSDIAKRILGRAVTIGLCLTFAYEMTFGGSFLKEAVTSGNYGQLAETIFSIAGSSAAISGVVEFIKGATKKQMRNTAHDAMKYTNQSFDVKTGDIKIDDEFSPENKE